MNIKYFMIVLVSLKISCAINDTYGNLIDINNFETFEMVPHLNRNHDSVKKYSKKLSSHFCDQDLCWPKFANDDPIFDGHDIYYKDNSELKKLLMYYKKIQQDKNTVILNSIKLFIFVGGSILLAAWW